MNITTITYRCIFTGAAFLFLCLVFRPLELAFPAKKGQKFFRPAWLTDLCFFFGQYLLWQSLVFAALIHLDHWLDRVMPGTFRSRVASLSWWSQFAIVI